MKEEISKEVAGEIFKKKLKQFKIATILIWSIVLLDIFFSRKIIDPTSTVGTINFVFALVVLPCIWLVLRMVNLKCTSCNKSYFMQKRLPRSCSKCGLSFQ